MHAYLVGQLLAEERRAELHAESVAQIWNLHTQRSGNNVYTGTL